MSAEPYAIGTRVAVSHDGRLQERGVITCYRHGWRATIGVKLDGLKWTYWYEESMVRADTSAPILQPLASATGSHSTILATPLALPTNESVAVASSASTTPSQNDLAPFYTLATVPPANRTLPAPTAIAGLLPAPRREPLLIPDGWYGGEYVSECVAAEKAQAAA